MAQVKRSWDLLTEQQRKAAIDDIISFFSSERNEEIGILAAENILDIFLQKIGTHLYNRGIEDTKKFINDRFEELGMDIDISLKK